MRRLGDWYWKVKGLLEEKSPDIKCEGIIDGNIFWDQGKG